MNSSNFRISREVFARFLGVAVVIAALAVGATLPLLMGQSSAQGRETTGAGEPPAVEYFPVQFGGVRGEPEAPIATF